MGRWKVFLPLNKNCEIRNIYNIDTYVYIYVSICV